MDKTLIIAALAGILLTTALLIDPGHSPEEQLTPQYHLNVSADGPILWAAIGEVEPSAAAVDRAQRGCDQAGGLMENREENGMFFLVCTRQ